MKGHTALACQADRSRWTGAGLPALLKVCIEVIIERWFGRNICAVTETVVKISRLDSLNMENQANNSNLPGISCSSFSRFVSRAMIATVPQLIRWSVEMIYPCQRENTETQFTTTLPTGAIQKTTYRETSSENKCFQLPISACNNLHWDHDAMPSILRARTHWHQITFLCWTNLKRKVKI